MKAIKAFEPVKKCKLYIFSDFGEIRVKIDAVVSVKWYGYIYRLALYILSSKIVKLYIMYCIYTIN